MSRRHQEIRRRPLLKRVKLPLISQGVLLVSLVSLLCRKLVGTSASSFSSRSSKKSSKGRPLRSASDSRTRRTLRRRPSRNAKRRRLSAGRKRMPRDSSKSLSSHRKRLRSRLLWKKKREGPKPRRRKISRG